MNRREDLNNIFEMYNLYKNSTANIGAAGGHLFSLEAVDPPLQIFLIVMYSLTAVLSLTGNTTAIIVLTFGRRYKAIVHPFDSRMKRYQSRYVMVGIWIMALCISSVQLIVSKTRSFTYDGEMHHECVEMWPEERHGQIYTAFIFTFTFAIPLLGLAYTYSIIAWKLWWRSAPGNADPCRDLHQLNAKIKVVKMLVTIVVMFALCWLPLQLFLFLFYFLPDFGVQHNDTAWQIYALSYFACHWMANANSCVNPLVYCFMSDNFRTNQINFKRVQFPIKLCFAMTINKAQGQTLNVAGIDLREDCFSNGQLYVACSRVSSSKDLVIFQPHGITANIVYKEIL
ncbi:substance-K receptor-like [Diaphorina citri]|uniref:Substance-K receptor-like n=1 Tax=Diaphorina citri TaxID=121845 RepID=A0A3Q0J1Z9_DIACI|nr:substance-K receptor-like [Diaphorina citri]